MMNVIYAFAVLWIAGGIFVILQIGLGPVLRERGYLVGTLLGLIIVIGYPFSFLYFLLVTDRK